MYLRDAHLQLDVQHERALPAERAASAAPRSADRGRTRTFGRMTYIAKNARPTTTTGVKPSAKSIAGPSPSRSRRKTTTLELWAAVETVAAANTRIGVVTSSVT